MELNSTRRIKNDNIDVSKFHDDKYNYKELFNRVGKLSEFLTIIEKNATPELLTELQS